MTRTSNKFPALARAQEWLAAHGEPLAQSETQERGITRRKSQVPDSDRESAPRRANGASRTASRDAGGARYREANRPPVDISHHERHCSICQHPERDAIEEAFLDWRPISNIAEEFKLPGRTTVYRHAHAFGLFPQRSRNLRFALGMVIEKAQHATATAESIVSAVRAYTRVTDAGEWVEPPTHVIVSSGTRMAENSPAYARRVAGSRTKALGPAPDDSPVGSVASGR